MVLSVQAEPRFTVAHVSYIGSFIRLSTTAVGFTLDIDVNWMKTIHSKENGHHMSSKRFFIITLACL